MKFRKVVLGEVGGHTRMAWKNFPQGLRGAEDHLAVRCTLWQGWLVVTFDF